MQCLEQVITLQCKNHPVAQKVPQIILIPKSSKPPKEGKSDQYYPCVVKISRKANIKINTSCNRTNIKSSIWIQTGR